MFFCASSRTFLCTSEAPWKIMPVRLCAKIFQIKWILTKSNPVCFNHNFLRIDARESAPKPFESPHSSLSNGFGADKIGSMGGMLMHTLICVPRKKCLCGKQDGKISCGKKSRYKIQYRRCASSLFPHVFLTFCFSKVQFFPMKACASSRFLCEKWGKSEEIWRLLIVPLVYSGGILSFW